MLPSPVRGGALTRFHPAPRRRHATSHSMNMPPNHHRRRAAHCSRRSSARHDDRRRTLPHCRSSHLWPSHTRGPSTPSPFASLGRKTGRIYRGVVGAATPIRVRHGYRPARGRGRRVRPAGRTMGRHGRVRGGASIGRPRGGHVLEPAGGVRLRGARTVRRNGRRRGGTFILARHACHGVAAVTYRRHGLGSSYCDNLGGLFGGALSGRLLPEDLYFVPAPRVAEGIGTSTGAFVVALLLLESSALRFLLVCAVEKLQQSTSFRLELLRWLRLHLQRVLKLAFVPFTNQDRASNSRPT